MLVNNNRFSPLCCQTTTFPTNSSMQKLWNKTPDTRADLKHASVHLIYLGIVMISRGQLTHSTLRHYCKFEVIVIYWIFQIASIHLWTKCTYIMHISLMFFWHFKWSSLQLLCRLQWFNCTRSFSPTAHEMFISMKCVWPSLARLWPLWLFSLI